MLDDEAIDIPGDQLPEEHPFGCLGTARVADEGQIPRRHQIVVNGTRHRGVVRVRDVGDHQGDRMTALATQAPGRDAGSVAEPLHGHLNSVQGRLGHAAFAAQRMRDGRDADLGAGRHVLDARSPRGQPGYLQNLFRSGDPRVQVPCRAVNVGNGGGRRGSGELGRASGRKSRWIGCFLALTRRRFNVLQRPLGHYDYRDDHEMTTEMSTAYLVARVRTPFGRYGGALAAIPPDDLAAQVLRLVADRLPSVDWADVDDVLIGCANQAGEDNRNVARMAVLLAGLPVGVPGGTLNRLCGSGLDTVVMAGRAVRSGDADLVLAGGVESMTRAPFVLAKAESAFSRENGIHDTTIGWRFVNPLLAEAFGTDSMPETAENVAAQYGVSREDQDAFSLRSQERTAKAVASGRLVREVAAVSVPQQRGGDVVVDRDEHPRETTLEELAALRAITPGGTVTAGNASGINDGAAAVLIASQRAVQRYGLTPLARVTAGAAVGVPPGVMGIGPAGSTQKLLHCNGLTMTDIDVVELNEAFAAQALAVLRDLGLADDAEHVNPNGGAIAPGPPAGCQRGPARLVRSAGICRAEPRRPPGRRHHVHRGRAGHLRPARIRVTAAPPARINFAGAAEIIDSRHIRPKRATLTRATEVDPRGTRLHRPHEETK